MWAQVLLANGNIRIGIDPARTVRRARQLLGAEGIILAELGRPCAGGRRAYLRWETEHTVAPWLPWSAATQSSVVPPVAVTSVGVPHAGGMAVMRAG